MKDSQLYSQILGIEKPWKVIDVMVSLPGDVVEVIVEQSGTRHGAARGAKGWKRLLGWMASRRLKPMQQTGKTLRKHLWGILNAVILGADNSHAESMNSRIFRDCSLACLV